MRDKLIDRHLIFPSFSSEAKGSFFTSRFRLLGTLRLQRVNQHQRFSPITAEDVFAKVTCQDS
jgi:hypothetical protein